MLNIFIQLFPNFECIECNDHKVWKRGGAVAARQAHNLQVGWSKLPSAAFLEKRKKKKVEKFGERKRRKNKWIMKQNKQIRNKETKKMKKENKIFLSPTSFLISTCISTMISSKKMVPPGFEPGTLTTWKLCDKPTTPWNHTELNQPNN